MAKEKGNCMWDSASKERRGGRVGEATEGFSEEVKLELASEG